MTKNSSISVRVHFDGDCIKDVISSMRWAGYWCVNAGELDYQSTMDRIVDRKLGFVLLEDEYEDATEETHKKHTLTLAKIKAGLTLMAKSHPSWFGDIVDNECDGPMADTLLQLALFGEVKYG